MSPAGAQLLGINDGYYNWYILAYHIFPDGAGSISANDVYNMDCGVTLVSNIDATIQIVAATKQVSATLFQAFTEKLQTYHLIANQPLLVTFGQNWDGGPGVGGSLFIGSAIFCRNITAGSNLTLISASLASSGSVKPYF